MMAASDKMFQQQKVKSTDDRLYCTTKSNWNSRYFSKTVKSNMSLWNFDRKVACPTLNISKEILSIKPKLKFSFRCHENNMISEAEKVVRQNKKRKSPVMQVEFGDSCLLTFINSCCRDNLPVPNVVHYVWYGGRELSFFRFVSFISVIRFVRPCLILLHGDALPEGIYWDYILAISPNIVHVRRKPLKKIFGQKTQYKEHAGDVMRIEALLTYGGIYLDTDTVIVRSLKPFRKYNCTMSVQSSGIMSSAFIMAERNASFLQEWLNGYKYSYKADSYVFNAMIYPRNIAMRRKDLIHIDFYRVSRPKSEIGSIVYTSNCIWKGIFGIHLFSRSFEKRNFANENGIRYFNSTIGSICRHVLFGDKELCF